MSTAVNFDLLRGSRLREFAYLHQPWFVGLLFATLMAGQALGFLVLGTGQAGLGLALSILVLHNLLALACSHSLTDLRHPVRPGHRVSFDLAPALLPLWRPDPDDALPTRNVSAGPCRGGAHSRFLSGRDSRCPPLLHVLFSLRPADFA